MFEFLRKLFGGGGCRKVELEADLVPAAGCTFGGKAEVEVKRYPCGTVKVEAEIKHSGMPDGSAVEVIVGGRSVMTLTVQSGFAKQEIRFGPEQAMEVPAVGDAVEMRLGGAGVYEGVFRRD